jgi:hypothetical protein
LVYSEPAGHDREGRALFVPCRREGNRRVVHLADHPPSSDAGTVEVEDDRRSMNSVLAGERVDRRAVSIEPDQRLDLGRRQSLLHRV